MATHIDIFDKYIYDASFNDLFSCCCIFTLFDASEDIIRDSKDLMRDIL